MHVDVDSMIQIVQSENLSVMVQKGLFQALQENFSFIKLFIYIGV